MKLAILHYHLNPGGVTRVIENQLRALDAALDPREAWQVLLLHGGEAAGWPPSLAGELRAVRLTLHTVAGLGYDEGPPQPGVLARAVEEVLSSQGFSPEDGTLHVHNHALGKNASLPGALAALAERGYPLLAQLHDFAEDHRPANYLRLVGHASTAPGEGLYPQASHIHYAALNRRDEAVLAAAGVARERLHLLPNPVFTTDSPANRAAARRRLTAAAGIAADARLVVYPVRGIRRKNAGEMLLHAALAPPGTVVAMTLPPLNPAEVPHYRAWVELARTLALGCRFDLAGESKLSLAENLAAADAVLTTSVAEGFGMVFLESWLLGRPLVGRDLPEITADFREAGMTFPWLQPALRIPLPWVGGDRAIQRLAEGYAESCRSYRQTPEPAEAAFAGRFREELIDFADLDEPLQAAVVERVARQPAAREEVLAHNPGLADALRITAEQAAGVIAANTSLVREHYAAAASGRRLAELLHRVACSPRGAIAPLPAPATLLAAFLRPERFRPLRS